MSRYGKYIIGILVSVALAIIAWQIVLSMNSNNEPAVTYSDTVQEHVQAKLSTSQDIYYSSDNAKINIAITSNTDSGKLMVEVAGMESRLGNNYFDEKKSINLSKDKTENIAFEKQLPQCSTCYGYPEGEYEIEVLVLRGSYVLAKEKVAFRLMP